MSTVRSSVTVRPPSCFLTLSLAGAAGRRVVGDGGRHHDGVGGVAFGRDSGVHFASGPHPDGLHPVRRGDRGRSEDERDLRPLSRRLGSHGHTHATTRAVPEVADGIEVLVRGARGHEDAASAQGPRRLDDAQGLGRDHVRLGEPALPHPAAREVALTGLDEPHAARPQQRHVGLRRRVVVHVGVHGRRDEYGRTRRQRQRGQEVAGQPVCQPGNGVGRGRGDEQQRGLGRERDVLDVGVGAGRPLAGDHSPLGNRLEREGPDEARRGTRHHDGDLVPGLLQLAHHFDRLVGADAAADADRHEGHAAAPAGSP